MSLQRTKPKNLRNLREDFAKLASLGVVEEDDDLNEGFCHYSIVDERVAYFNNQQSLQKIHVVKSFFSFRIVSVFVFVPAGFSNHYGRYFTI